MSMYKNCMEFISNVKTIEMAGGFIQYRINNDKSCYISMVWVEPEFRSKNLSYELQSSVEKIARESGCIEMYCQSDIQNQDIDSSIITILKNGYKTRGWDNKIIEFYKELK